MASPVHSRSRPSAPSYGASPIRKGHCHAIEDFNQAIALKPRHGAAFNNRAWAWSEKCEYDKAIEDANQCLRIIPEDMETLHQCLELYKAKKPYREEVKKDQMKKPS
jgi:tetratricopeptide (TPR) repeat protein